MPAPHLRVHMRPGYHNAIVINKLAYEDTEFAHHDALKKEERLLDEDKQLLYLVMKNRFFDQFQYV